MLPRPTTEAFDVWLTERRLSLLATVVGGPALALLGAMNADVRLPLLEASDATRTEVAAALKRLGKL